MPTPIAPRIIVAQNAWVELQTSLNLSQFVEDQNGLAVEQTRARSHVSGQDVKRERNLS